MPVNQTYDIHETYQHNYDAGPQLAGIDVSVPDTPTKNFLGFEVASRLGIAAGLLLNSRWIQGYAELGFDLLTYKTVRSGHRPCYPVPNWVFVEERDPSEDAVYQVEAPSEEAGQVSSAVCFGMPSMAPDVWRADVARAKAGLGSEQRLIVSVVATPQPGWGPDELAADFAQCATWAAESGADLVEANFSCPNVCSAEGSIYLDPELSGRIAAIIRNAIPTTPLLLKVGYFGEQDGLSRFIHAVAPHVSGVTLVNGVTKRVLDPNGQPVFGPQYERAGVLGRTIHSAAVASVRAAREVVREAGLDLALLAVGGASTVADVEDFYHAGADAVMLGSSPMYLPGLAATVKRALPWV